MIDRHPLSKDNMKFLFLTLIALHVVSGQPERGDQSPPREEDWDIGNKTLEEDHFDEDIQEMTTENTQHNGGSALERIDENQVVDKIHSGERQESYPVWKILLVVAGSAVGLVLMVSSVILVLKSRNNYKEGEGTEEPSVPKEDET